MKFKGEHILFTQQFDKEELLSLFAEAKKMEKVIADAKKGKESKILEGKIMATLFFEPSTRTRFSFEVAMLRLGGRVVSNPDMLNTSSLKKMESLEDTGRTIAEMVDVIAMRHPEMGAVAKLAKASRVPVINGGDGAGDHPTQGLLDVYTIWKEKGRLEGLTVGLIGDLKYSRVLHSQVILLSKFKGVKFVLVSPKELKLPAELKKEISRNITGVNHLPGDTFVEVENLASVIADLDVISVNRIQTERFSSEAEAEKFRGKFVVSREVMKKAKKSAIIICPLPRREELPTEVDADPRARYFEQVKNGVAVRMALLKKVLVR